MTTPQTLHVSGDTKPQNAAESIKFTLPRQTTDLGLLDDEEPVLWQIDEELGQPVVSQADYFGEMCGTYGEPELRKVRSGTTTVPKEYTRYAYGGGHPQANFTRDDIIGFFGFEPKIANDFPRLYVGTPDDYKRFLVEENFLEIIWGETYRRGVFAPGHEMRVREISVVPPGEEPFRITRPASEEWMRARKFSGRQPRLRHRHLADNRRMTTDIHGYLNPHISGETPRIVGA